MPFDFDPQFQKDAEGKVIGITHPQARVKADAEELAGEVIEIRGTTTDGRRLCVTGDGRSAWLGVENLEQS